MVNGERSRGRYYTVNAFRLWPIRLVTEAFPGRRQLNRRVRQLRDEGFRRIRVEKRHAEDVDPGVDALLSLQTHRWLDL